MSIFPNAWLVARREYLGRVRSRAFVISTVVLAGILVLLSLAPVALQSVQRSTTARMAIVVEAPGMVTDPVADATAILGIYASSVGGAPPFAVESRPSVDAASADLDSGTLRALMVIDRGTDGRLTFDVRTNAGKAGTQAVYLRLVATWIATRDALQRATDATGSSDIIGSFEITPLAGTPPPASDVQAVGNLILATVLVILIFITIMAYGMWIATSVAEEKSSRVMELMLSAATPIQMLTGKVMGVGAAGLTQYGLLLTAGLAGLAVQQPVGRAFFHATGDSPPISGLSPAILVGFGVFFVLGFALYAVLYAAAGSLVSRQEDIQQVAMPMIGLSMTGYILASLAISSIDAAWVAPLSFVPFFSPFLMLVRLTVGSASPGEVLISVAILVVTILIAMRVAARVYTVGVLMYGQRPGVRQFLAAARTGR
jgi:ABC-2 type transport system permease protein